MYESRPEEWDILTVADVLSKLGDTCMSVAALDWMRVSRAVGYLLKLTYVMRRCLHNENVQTRLYCACPDSDISRYYSITRCSFHSKSLN